MNEQVRDMLNIYNKILIRKEKLNKFYSAPIEFKQIGGMSLDCLKNYTTKQVNMDSIEL